MNAWKEIRLFHSVWITHGFKKSTDRFRQSPVIHQDRLFVLYLRFFFHGFLLKSHATQTRRGSVSCTTRHNISQLFELREDGLLILRLLRLFLFLFHRPLLHVIVLELLHLMPHPDDLPDQPELPRHHPG